MKNGNAAASVKLAKKYVADQLKIIKKFGTPVKLSNKQRRILVEKVSRASAG